MKAAPGSPGFELPGEPDAGRVADCRLVAGRSDALPDPPNDGRESEHRCRQGRCRPLPKRATEELDNRVQAAKEWRAYRQHAVIQSIIVAHSVDEYFSISQSKVNQCYRVALE